MNTNSLQWETANITRRWEPHEFAESEFDGVDKTCSTRVFLFTQPRTASFTVCRYFYAAGWGLPLEYFGPRLLASLPQRLMRKSISSSAAPFEMSEYRTAIEASRSRNAIFSAKIMWGQYSRLKASFRGKPEQFNSAAHLYLYRGDFADQVVSFWLQQKTGVYSFSAIDKDPDIHVFPGSEEINSQLAKSAEFLLGTEKRWLNEFASRALNPLIVRTEDFLSDPATLIADISKTFHLRFDPIAVLECEKFERDGRYQNQYRLKREIKKEYGDLLKEAAGRREEQLRNYEFFSKYARVG